MSTIKVTYVNNYVYLEIQSATELTTIVAPVNEILVYLKSIFTRAEYKLDILEDCLEEMLKNEQLEKNLKDELIDRKNMENRIRNLEASVAALRGSNNSLIKSNANLEASVAALRRDHEDLKAKVIATFTHRNVVTTSEVFEIWEVKALTTQYRIFGYANANEIAIDVAYGNPDNIDKHPFSDRSRDRLIDSFEVANGRTLLKKLCKELADSDHVKVILPDKKFIVEIGYEYEILDAIEDIKRDADSVASELTE